jgi:[CysO sulfur-carrier protein]-S-L-cysteine hydrolase
MTPSEGTLELPATMRNEIIAHAIAEAPRECCGVIEGRDGRLTRLHRLTNVYEGVDFYEPEARELYRLLVDLDGRQSDVAVIYHSHPISVAYPSKRDVEFAGWPDSVYVICSLENAEAPVVRAFRIAENQITELTIKSA